MSVYHLAETNMPKHAKTNTPKHGSGPPEAFSEIKPAKTCLQTACQKCLSQQDTKHAKSCQDTTCQTMNKQASNMAAYLLKKSQKYRANVAHIKHASVLSHLSPDHMNPASAMKTKRKTTNSAAARRSTQKVIHKRQPRLCHHVSLNNCTLQFTIHKTHKQCLMYCIF